MVIDASAIVAILARRPQASDMLARIDAARPPLFVTPLALFEAARDLARTKAADAGIVAGPGHHATAAEAVAAFASALGLREIPITADIGRRAAALASGGDATGHCFSAACAAAYRTTLLTA